MGAIRTVLSHGKRIEVETLDDPSTTNGAGFFEKFKSKRGKASPKQKRRKHFKVDWAKFPNHWRETLKRANSAGKTYELAVAILFEAFRQEYIPAARSRCRQE